MMTKVSPVTKNQDHLTHRATIYDTGQGASHRSRASIPDFDPRTVFSYNYRRCIVRRRMHTYIAVTLLSLYGMIITFVIAELEMQCLRGAVNEPKNGGLWAPQFKCVCDATAQTCLNAELDLPTNESAKHFQFCRITAESAKVDTMKAMCPSFRHSFGLRISLTISTVCVLVLTAMYHYYDVKIFKFDNSLTASVVVRSKLTYCKKIVEMVLLAIHPIWLHNGVVWFVDYYLVYYVTLIRLIYALRIFILQSYMFDSTKVQSVANLNAINIGALSVENVRLIIRTFMDHLGGKIIVLAVTINFVTIGWMIRLAEAQYNYQFASDQGVANIGDALWLVPITFFTVGYGDFYPKSTLGRILCVWLALTGALCTAILINIMTSMLSMTRRERLLFRTLNTDALRHNIVEKAAVVIQRVWRASKNGKVVLSKPLVRTATIRRDKTDPEDATAISHEPETSKPAFCAIVHDGRILRAITEFRKQRIRYKFIDDRDTDLVDVGIQQSKMLETVHKLEHEVKEMAGTMEEVRALLARLSDEKKTI